MLRAPMAHTRPYLFYGATQALCATCLRVVEAKELIEDGRVVDDHGRLGARA